MSTDEAVGGSVLPSAPTLPMRRGLAVHPDGCDQSADVLRENRYTGRQHTNIRAEQVVVVPQLMVHELGPALV